MSASAPSLRTHPPQPAVFLWAILERHYADFEAGFTEIVDKLLQLGSGMLVICPEPLGRDNPGGIADADVKPANLGIPDRSFGPRVIAETDMLLDVLCALFARRTFLTDVLPVFRSENGYYHMITGRNTSVTAPALRRRRLVFGMASKLE